jgi:uncharacterized coiled-coil DUF342 family protein
MADTATIIISLAKRFIETLEGIEERLAALQTQLGKVETMAAKEFDELAAQIEENAGVEDSALQLIQGIAAQLDAAKNDPAQLAAMASRLRSSADALAAAVAANTPAE